MSQQQESGKRFEEQQLIRLQRRLLDVKKARLVELMQEGIVSEPVSQELTGRFDRQLAEMEEYKAGIERKEEN